MAIIGYVNRKDDGSFTGELLTLTLEVPIAFVPIPKKTDNAPSWRIMAGRAEVGSAWLNENEKTGRKHVSLTLEGPELPFKINANLGRAPGQDSDDAFDIIWNRAYGQLSPKKKFNTSA